MVSEVKQTNFERKRTPNRFNNMANQSTQYVKGLKMDWTEDAGLHQQFKDWREEVELLLDMVLSHIRNQETRLKYVSDKYDFTNDK